MVVAQAVESKTVKSNKEPYILIYSAFIAGLCSIIYELLIATTVSYFLGDSIKYFSITIGLYMAAMGAGSFLSKYMNDRLLVKFISAELWLGLVGGMSIPLLYFSYAYTEFFIAIYVIVTILIGFLIGLEIPFLTRLMENYNSLKYNIANILSFDYIGALLATLSFPFILLPFCGVYQSSLIFGIVNMSIAIAMLWGFSHHIKDNLWKLKKYSLIASALLIFTFIFSGYGLKHWSNALYEDRIIFSKQTPYQKIILTKFKDDIRLFLDGNLQFSSIDEYRYHEALVHIPIQAHQSPIKRVLLLGAGDGLAVRELLKYDMINEIILVDLDPEIVKLTKNNIHIRKLNHDSLAHPKVTIINADALSFLKENDAQFDMIISDLPDPNNTNLARLYTKNFYHIIQNNLSYDGIFVTQATSPYYAKNAFWSIAKTINNAGFTHHHPYHVNIPSFGEWGFIMASNKALNFQNIDINIPTEFISDENFQKYFHFEKDIAQRDTQENTLNNLILLQYYLDGWRHYAR